MLAMRRAELSMSSESQHDNTQQHLIPKVTCPQCGTHLRLAGIEPDRRANRSRLVFDCSCGFEYRMSERARMDG
jgi:RNase P subunit RPR2